MKYSNIVSRLSRNYTRSDQEWSSWKLHFYIAKYIFYTALNNTFITK